MDGQIVSVLGSLAASITANLIWDVCKNIVKLLPHQESNLAKWLKSWNPTENDFEIIKNDKTIQRIVSILFEKAENEIFEEKLANWGKIADAVVRNKKQDYSNDLYFVKLFSDMPLSVISYLLEIYKTGESEMVGQYPRDNKDLHERYFCENYCVCLSLTECFTGKPKLTEFGKKFIDFIGTEYQSIK